MASSNCSKCKKKVFMNDDYLNFQTWFKKVLNDLYPQQNAGLAILLITFPLLERYLRCKSRIFGTLKPKFYKELNILFPRLKELGAKDFWDAYRNGLLHRLIMKKRSGASHEIHEPIIKIDGTFWIHPVKFADYVVSAIECNFETFAASPGIESLPKIGIYEPLQNGSSFMMTTTFWGTR